MFAFFASLFINLVIGEIQGWLTKPKGATAEDVDIPTATEDRPQQYGAGVFAVAGNVIWSGDYLQAPVKEEVKVSLLSSKDVTVGYEYHAGLWMTLAGVNCDQILAVKLGDDVIWEGVHELGTGVSELVIDKRWKEDGAQVRDGLFGVLRFFNLGENASTNLVNEYVESQVGGPVPQYPGRLSVVWLGPSAKKQSGSTGGGFFDKLKRVDLPGFFGGSPQFKPMVIVCSRKPRIDTAVYAHRWLTYPITGNQQSTQNRDAFAAWLTRVQDVEGDANPALVLLELLTARAPGLGPRVNADMFDAESFLMAAELLKEEGIGCSFGWTATDALSNRIEALLRLMQATPRLGEGGVMSLQLLRDKDEPRFFFDDSNIVTFDSFERIVPEQAANVIELVFKDRAADAAERVAQSKDPAGVKSAGSVIVQQVDVMGVTRPELATKLTSRELRCKASQLATVVFEAMMPVGTDIQPGDLIEVTHGPLGQTLRMRVTSARFGALTNTQSVRLEALEDVFRPGFSKDVVSPLPEVPVVPQDPVGVVGGGLMLAPYALSREEVDVPLFFALAPPTGLCRPFRAAAQSGVSVWNDAWVATYSNGDAAPSVQGTLGTNLPALAAGGVSITVTASQAAYLKERGLTATLALAGDELLYLDNLNVSNTSVSGQIRARGVYDTSPGPHAVGDQVILLTGYLIYPEALKTDTNTAGAAALVIRAEVGGELRVTTEQGYRYVTYNSPSRAARPLPMANIGIATGTKPGFTPETANGNFGRVSSLTVTGKFRDRDLCAITSYIADENQLCGLKMCVRVGWQLPNGTWAENDVVRGAVDAHLVTVSTTNVPAGARLGRIRVWSETVGGVSSREHVLYFNFTA